MCIFLGKHYWASALGIVSKSLLCNLCASTKQAMNWHCKNYFFKRILRQKNKLIKIKSNLTGKCYYWYRTKIETCQGSEKKLMTKCLQQNIRSSFRWLDGLKDSSLHRFTWRSISVAFIVPQRALSVECNAFILMMLSETNATWEKTVHKE